ncbi:neural cell adhesion molecule L1-like protein isoform X2 [Syngnathoides biaculeatus]|uniref:neural cell adhesion molecule L1-like protein isoform X2 n=1 Tax=Syngnathoides biaculeatus TaxID=300417 RepID=UPI002ADDF26E|nr:neural cell adhesion molecule L1-like protein isoform X2 [Syngnathoides biaculeatus]
MKVMSLQRSWRIIGILASVTFICAFRISTAIDMPLEVEQLPTITAQSPSSLIAFPFDESYPVTCEARGNPEPEIRWMKNGQEFDPSLDPRLMKEEDSGTFVIPNNGNLTEYQGTYLCYASNKLGTATSKEIEFIVPHVPKFPKETLDPIVVEEGQAFILKCDPPKGIPPLQIYWMTINLQHIEQDERVSMALNGDLYFSHAVEKDSRRDYCCFAAFPRIRTIVQKTAMSVIVKTKKSHDMSAEIANAILQRRPLLMTPSGVRTEKQFVRGDDLKLECIPDGFPTPQVEWVKMGHKLPIKAKLESHGKMLIIPSVEQEDSGKYMCKARNRVGDVVHYFTITVEEPPEWVFEPESQLSMIDSDVHIKCSATGTPKPTISWRVNGRPLHEAPAANRKVFDDTIILHNAKASDSAVYQCQASNRHGTLLANANIMIMNLPPMILTKEVEDYSAVEGRGVMMHCHVFSSPPSTITWSKDDSSEFMDGPRFTVHDNGSLEIYATEKYDTGQYTCYARNTEGSSAIEASLYVKDPTRITVAPEDQRILIGTTAQLSCLVEYDKSFFNDFELLWEKDDMDIGLNYTDNSRYFMENGILQIFNVSLRDQGVYTCVGRTPVDQVIASALLMVLDVPDPPEHLVLSEQKTKSVKLKWTPGDNHNSSTTEFIIQYEESQWEPGNWKELLRVPGNHISSILKLHGYVDYRFRVAGVNGVGRGPPSEPTERYKTPPRAPDKNPENIKIKGHLPHEMDINWEPLLPIEHNGPGLEYKVSYRQQNLEEDWKEHIVKRHSFVVKNTPTFVPYEIKIHARNNQGWGPEPTIVTGYSGEDFPSAAPDDVAVVVMNSSVVKVSWTRVNKDKLHGHLGGYRINWWRLRSLVDLKKSHEDKQTLTFPGDRNHAIIPRLQPFSEYSLIVMTFNGRGNGPGSHPVNFKTPEGVPEKNPVFKVTDTQRHTVSLAWAPPSQPNGILTGYLLEYQLINNTDEVGQLQTIDISKPDTTKWTLRDLEPLSKYKFHLRSCTTVGCGPIISEESTTTLEASLASIHAGISNQGWFIGLLCAIAFLTLMMLIACFVNRNKGGKYSVKEKEDLHPEMESQGMNDDTFCEYREHNTHEVDMETHTSVEEI